MQNPTDYRRQPSTFIACAVVSTSYTLAGAVGVWLLHHILKPDLAAVAPAIGVPWLAVGVGVAGLLLYGTRAWPGIFIGSYLVWGVIQQDYWASVLIDAIGETISVVLIVRLLRAWGYRETLSRHQDAFILILAVAIGRVVSSTIDVLASISAAWLDTEPMAVAVEAAAGVSQSAGSLVLNPALFSFVVRWWANSTVGTILIVPLLAFLHPGVGHKPAGSGLELGCWWIAGGLWVAISLSTPGSLARLPLLAAALILVVWATMRFGVAVSSVGTLVFSMTATAGFGLQLGTFAGIGGREGVEIVWGFVGLLASSALFLTALLSGREEKQRQVEQSIERYRRLFFANPRPMWAEEVASGKLIMVNASAIDAYGYTEAEFLSLRSADLRYGHESIAQPLRAARSAVATTHRTASGLPLEVEMTAVPMELDGVALRACVVTPVGEQNDLRIAVLNETDLERQRLGRRLRDRLGPFLARLSSVVEELGNTSHRDMPIDQGRLASIENDAVAATAQCRELSRGASQIHYVAGDLVEALRRIPEELSVDGFPKVKTSVHSFAVVRMPLERCEHVYSVVREAIRLAAQRPEVRNIAFSLEVTNAALEVTIEDDGRRAAGAADRTAPSISAMAVRAAAAHARIDDSAPSGGGNRLHIECLQSLEAEQISQAAAARACAPSDTPDPSVLAPRKPPVNRSLESSAFAIILAATALAVAAGLSSMWRVELLGLSLIVVVWPAVRFGIAGATAAILVLSLAAAVGHSIAGGAAAGANTVEGEEVLWGFIGLLTTTGLFLTTVISKYERTARDLAVLQARFEALFEALPMPLFAYDEHGGHITMVNGAAIRKYGYSRAEFLQMSPEALEAGPPPAAWDPAQLNRLGHATISSVHRSRAGSKFEVEVSLTPVIVAGNTEILCFMIDVTERNNLRRRLLEASDVERRRLAHDLHDGLGQILTGLSLGITTLRRAIERGGTPSLAAVEFVAEAIREARQTCDQILHGLSPLESTSGDLIAALRHLPVQIPPESRDKLKIDITAASPLLVSLPVRGHLHQIARECVNNALKHANATHIRVTMNISETLITLVVEDDGIGFDPAAERAEGLGLHSLALRAEAIQGRISIERRPAGGMMVTCQCPQPSR